MPSQASLAAYVDGVRSMYIDVDGVFGAQCWDQWSHYATNFLGVPTGPTYTNAGGTHPHAGYACNVYHNARAAGLEQWFEILPPSAAPRPGDVAFWEYGSAWYPWSHVATVLEVTHGGRMLRCLTQNPGAVQIADLITSGIIGYLRPRSLTIGNVNGARTPALPAKKKNRKRRRRIRRNKEDNMIFIMIHEGGVKKGEPAYAVFRLGQKGTWWQFAGRDAAGYLSDQLGMAMPVVWSEWERLKKRHE